MKEYTHPLTEAFVDQYDERFPISESTSRMMINLEERLADAKQATEDMRQYCEEWIKKHDALLATLKPFANLAKFADIEDAKDEECFMSSNTLVGKITVLTVGDIRKAFAVGGEKS